MVYLLKRGSKVIRRLSNKLVYTRVSLAPLPAFLSSGARAISIFRSSAPQVHCSLIQSSLLHSYAGRKRSLACPKSSGTCLSAGGKSATLQRKYLDSFLSRQWQSFGLSSIHPVLFVGSEGCRGNDRAFGQVIMDVPTASVGPPVCLSR